MKISEDRKAHLRLGLALKYLKSRGTVAERTCAKCGKLKPLAFFTTRGESAIKELDPYLFICLDCQAAFLLAHPEQRINSIMASQIHRYIKRPKKGSRSKNPIDWEKLVGYKLSDLMAHLEAMFRKEMVWGNYGKWHIDHIRPISSFCFDSFDHPEFKECWALENLQPLWARDNLIKGSKWPVKERPNKARGGVKARSGGGYPCPDMPYREKREENT